ncbi:MAG: 16S rRNA pseudouridine(516) synthase [Halioglobus sp.]
MQSRSTRLDRFISKRIKINRKDVRQLLAQGRILVDGSAANQISQVIEQFTHVTLDGQVLQAHTPIYIMMNKPTGVVSATQDLQHQTVVDLLDRADAHTLHIVGRLDFNTSGLLLLTNDGKWSRQLTTPENKVTKWYRVRLANPITPDYQQAFAAGMYFPFENITTRPAILHILTDHVAEVGLVEGRYHQIKRMFGRFDNPVVELHRERVGELLLDPLLAPGQSRDLTTSELISTTLI